MKKVICVIAALILCLSLSVTVLADDYKVSGAPAIVIDGVITDEEWGTPILKGVDKAAASDGSVNPIMQFWDFDPSYAGSENFDLYINNDSVNVYFGLVMHNTEIDSSSDGSNLWQHQNFTFTYSYSDPDNTVPHIEYNGDQYEQYQGYRVGLLADGSTKCECLHLGVDMFDLYEGSDYMVKYDEANKTMTYEVAIPYVGTNMNIDNPYMAFSVVAPLKYDSNGASAAANGSSRFLIGTGAAFAGGPNNFAHKGQAAVCVLNDAATVAGVVPGGAVKEEEPVAEEAEEEAEVKQVIEEKIVVEKVEKELVLKPGLQLIVIIASGVIVLASIVVIVLSLVKKSAKKAENNDSSEENTEASAEESSEE